MRERTPGAPTASARITECETFVECTESVCMLESAIHSIIAIIAVGEEVTRLVDVCYWRVGICRRGLVISTLWRV